MLQADAENPKMATMSIDVERDGCRCEGCLEPLSTHIFASHIHNHHAVAQITKSDFCQHTSSAGILAVLTALLDEVVDHGDALEGSS